MKQTRNAFDWWYVRLGGVISVRFIRRWAKIFRKTEFRVNLGRPISHGEPTVIAANHQTLLDPPGVFSPLSLRQLWNMSPVKFMAWHKYYNSKFKLPLYTTGCYPSHGDGLSGVEAAIFYAKNGYRSFIFPEGKRIKNGVRTPAYPGITKTLEQLPDARLLLVRIDWEKRTSRFSRPKLYVHMFDAPGGIDRTDPDAVMDAIYKEDK